MVLQRPKERLVCTSAHNDIVSVARGRSIMFKTGGVTRRRTRRIRPPGGAAAGCRRRAGRRYLRPGLFLPFEAGRGREVLSRLWGCLDPLYRRACCWRCDPRDGRERLSRGWTGDTSAAQLANGAQFTRRDRMRRLVCEYYDGFASAIFIRNFPEMRGRFTRLLATVHSAWTRLAAEGRSTIQTNRFAVDQTRHPSGAETASD